MVQLAIGLIFEAVLASAPEWLPWPRKGKTFQIWWRDKSVAGKVWVTFCWLFMAAVLALVATAFASVLPKSSTASV